MMFRIDFEMVKITFVIFKITKKYAFNLSKPIMTKRKLDLKYKTKH